MQIMQLCVGILCGVGLWDGFPWTFTYSQLPEEQKGFSIQKTGASKKGENQS